MEIGSQVGRHRIESFLGKGAMAEVYKVWHQDLHRHEAMKVLPPALTHDRSFVERFLREARTAAGLHHPNIATVYTVSGADAPQPYFTMELLEGGDLADLIEARGRFSLEQASPILRQIAAALDYAHGRGLMHRDVKPANVMLTASGETHDIKVVDFGLARAQEAQGGTRMTQTGMIVGTPEYMSPEQGGSGAPVDHRTDIYALGVVAYEMLCGEPPFKAARDTSMLAVIMQHVRDAPRPPLELAPSLTKSANAAILRALAKEPEERFGSCGEFIKALEGAPQSGSVRKPAAVPRTEAAAGGVKKAGPLVPMLLGAALFGGVGLIGYSAWSNGNNGEVVVSAPAETATTEAISEPLPQATVAAATISVPQIVGKTEAQAREILKANGLGADATTGYSEAFETRQVMSQFPTPGSAVGAGAKVRFRISLGAQGGATGKTADKPTETSVSFRPDSGDIAAVKGRYQSWLSAWGAMNIEAYMDFYSRSVRQKRASGAPHGYSTLRKRMNDNWSRQGYVSIGSDDPDVSIDGEQLVLTAFQSYDSSTYWDKGVKRVVWGKEGGEWKIVEESFRKRDGGKK